MLMSIRSFRRTYAIFAGALLLLAGSYAGEAQYDRDGRYVPSPMGKPADPYARPIPLYPGTPGEAIGTPIWPRDPQLRLPPVTTERPDTSPSVNSSGARVVPLTLEQCDAGWSADLGLPRVQFNRRCKRMRFLEKQHRDDAAAGSG